VAAGALWPRLPLALARESTPTLSFETSRLTSRRLPNRIVTPQSLRIPLFQLLALVLPGRLLPSAHTALHTLALETVRFGALIIVVPRLEGEDRWRWPDVWRQWPAFAGSVWFGLGWAVGEVAVGIWQGAFFFTSIAAASARRSSTEATDTPFG
jgi:hypothetical protein